MVDLDVHGNPMDRNVHGNRPQDIHGNELDRPLVGPPSTGGGVSQGGYDSAGNPVQGSYTGPSAAPGGGWEVTTTPRSVIFLRLGLLSLALWGAALYFDWTEIPVIHDRGWFLYSGIVLLVTFMFPAQVGVLVACAGVLCVFVGACPPGGFDLSAAPLGNWLVGFVLVGIGSWVASRGRLE